MPDAPASSSLPAGPSNGVFRAKDMARGRSAPKRLDSTKVVNVLDRVLFVAVVGGLIAFLLVTVIRRTGNDPFVDVEVPVQRSAAVQIDLNTAAWYDLMLLEGIGETLARRIVEDRDARGPLASVDDLTRVPGIGVKTVQRLRQNATVRGASLSLRDGFVEEPMIPAEFAAAGTVTQ